MTIRRIWQARVQLFFAGCAMILSAHPALAQTPAQGSAQGSARWAEQQSVSAESFRGMSAAGQNVVWVSGTRGTYLWTEDGGARWHVGAVPGALSLDFRDVHAVSLDTAYLMAAGQDTARIYKTVDRGQHWSLQYDDISKGAFLDAIAFFDPRHGLALGDPINGYFTLLETHDGKHWHRLSDKALPAALAGEAAFAASGTALITCGARDAWFATGGASVSRVFRTHDAGRSWTASETPIKAGNAAAGIFSLACRDSLHGVAVGGNYANPDSTALTVALTEDGGVTWTAAPPSSATAYLSSVAYLAPSDSNSHNGEAGSRLVGVGTRGTALSADGGRHWRRVDPLSLNVVVPLHGRTVALGAGDHGRIAALTIAPIVHHVMDDATRAVSDGH